MASTVLRSVERSRSLRCSSRDTPSWLSLAKLAQSHLFGSERRRLLLANCAAVLDAVPTRLPIPERGLEEIVPSDHSLRVAVDPPASRNWNLRTGARRRRDRLVNQRWRDGMNCTGSRYESIGGVDNHAHYTFICETPSADR